MYGDIVKIIGIVLPGLLHGQNLRTVCAFCLCFTAEKLYPGSINLLAMLANASLTSRSCFSRIKEVQFDFSFAFLGILAIICDGYTYWSVMTKEWDSFIDEMAYHLALFSITVSLMGDIFRTMKEL